MSEGTENSETHPCTIVLRDLKTGTLKPIYDWNRDDSWNGGIDVFWSPSSSAVILNNYISSNTGESVLFMVEPRFERVNLSAEVFTAHPTSFDWNYAHEYPAGTWINSDTIRLKLTGHHDTEAGGVFTYTYIYKLSTRSSRLVKHVEGSCDREHDLC